MKVRLYVIPGSHPSMTARLILEHKGIPYKRTDLAPVVSKGVVRAVGFPRNTVPAMKIDGRKVQGSKEIARELDRVQPEPRVVPEDPVELAKVEEAEAFGEEVLQPAVRRELWNTLKRDRAPMASLSEGARLGVPVSVAVKTGGPIVAMAARFNEATDENVRADLESWPEWLDRIDGWIAERVMGGEQLNVADFQVGTSVRLAMTLQDLRPFIEGRPAGALAMRVAPDYPGDIPPALPPEWLEPLRSGVAAL
jgi:glutathione S-transferase